MPVVIHGADSDDFVRGHLIWSALNALAPAKAYAPDCVDLTGLLLARPHTVAAIAALGCLAHGNAELILPTSQDARNFVVRSGLLDLFSCREAPRLSASPRIVPVRQLAHPSPTFADEISSAWDLEFGGMPAGLRPRLAGHLDELLLNALSHAESSIGCVVAAQVYPSVPSVELTVLDLGQTIRGHLSKTRQYATLTDDAEAIVMATEEGVTGTPAGQVNRLGDPNSGVGLFELREYCQVGGGQLSIVSGLARVTFGSGHEPIAQPFAGGFPGCLVRVRFQV
jgi:hypothetical protein